MSPGASFVSETFPPLASETPMCALLWFPRTGPGSSAGSAPTAVARPPRSGPGPHRIYSTVDRYGIHLRTTAPPCCPPAVPQRFPVLPRRTRPHPAAPDPLPARARRAGHTLAEEVQR
ncbi:hypothetical protein Kpho02_41580 [Kitasatospora phosalacinea]|uniref:Uncharacterized protein n=1 Tax=Kitasatospora phosalacinea TaxID=2065 RepID=A0A9W6QB53_9ACTN|nr:hypothetical protein Kpho02_41580 [Kitasatospora phosalacinea]